jgi:hypothetical protein
MYRQGVNLEAGVVAVILIFLVVGWLVNKIAKRPLMTKGVPPALPGWQ